MCGIVGLSHAHTASRVAVRLRWCPPLDLASAPVKVLWAACPASTNGSECEL